jgi:hypothetical protein
MQVAWGVWTMWLWPAGPDTALNWARDEPLWPPAGLTWQAI